MPGVDRERREHRVDLVVEALAQGVVVLGDVVVVEDRDPLGGELPMEVREDRALLGHELAPPGPGSRPAGPRPSGRRRTAPASRSLLAPQARDPDLEELVEVVDEEEQGPDPVEEGIALVAGLVEHARVELEPRQLAVEDRMRCSRAARRRPRAAARGPGAGRTAVMVLATIGPDPGRGRDDTATRSRSGRRGYHAADREPLRRTTYSVPERRLSPPRRTAVRRSSGRADPHLDARRRVDEALVRRPEPGLGRRRLAPARAVVVAGPSAASERYRSRSKTAATTGSGPAG